MLKEIIKEIFGSSVETSRKDTFSIFELKYTCSNLTKLSEDLNESNYNLLNGYLSELNYNWEIYIEDFSFSISQDEFNELDVDDNSEEFEIIFKVHKAGNKLLIVDEDLFNSFIRGFDLESVLKFFNTKKFPLTFLSEDYELEIGNVEEQETTEYLSKQCNFRNYAQYPFSPQYFYLKKDSNKKYPVLSDYLNRISLVYCLIYIFDSTEIQKDEINTSLSGFKTIKFSLNFKDLDIKNLEHYYKIYNWIYSDRNKIEDKISISRNIITSYINNKTIEIDDATFKSILSSYQIYIKGIINKYFEARNKIIEQVENTVKKVNESLETFSSNFQKSTLVIISFFLSVFLSKVIKQQDLSKIFNKETSNVAFAFIFLSVIYLLFSRWILKLDKIRIKERYESVKERYNDILITEDINNILKNDAEYNSEIKYFKSRIFIYTSLWVITIAVFVIIIYLTSDSLTIPYIENNPASKN